MTLDLTDDEAAALSRHLRHALDYDPYPLAPRLDPLKAILAKLEPPAPKPEPLPPLSPASGRASEAGEGDDMNDLGTVLAALHDSEINGEISWFYDRIWLVKLGDPHNRYEAEAIMSSPEAAAEWLRTNAVRLHPDSDFARRYRGFA